MVERLRRVASSRDRPLTFAPFMRINLRWARDCAELPIALDLDEAGSGCVPGACSDPVASAWGGVAS